ncbi:hypothetical protein ACFYP4_02285 [Streptomyces sp. NPDC005551]|uniref:hypothetical protein n=1 Tax=Streptomyces sp. NPDC005551 TaxID=3364725 RepID=UPI0036A218B7
MGKKAPLPSRHSRGIKANEVTEIFVEQLQERESNLRSKHPWVVPVLNAASEGRVIPLDFARPALSVREQAHIVDMASQVGTYKLWAKNGRITYDLNEHLAAELYRSTYDKLPGNIFSHLPHINPLVVLPEPWLVNHQGSDGLVRGFFIYGFNDEPDRQTLTDEDIDGLGLLMVIDLVDLDTGDIRGQTYMRLRIPTRLAEFTLAEAVDYAGGRVEAMYATGDKVAREQTWELIETLVSKALGILIYLCCDNRDAVETTPRSTGARRRGAAAPRERYPFWVEVGWKMGPQLHAARRTTGRTGSGPEVPSGVQRAAHQRAGHFHKFRVGPGRPNERTQLLTRWVRPHWVGLQELPEDMDPITTVVTVDAQRHDPLRRRGLKARR